MAKQINQYTKIRLAANMTSFDLIDLDSTEDSGSTFESAKITSSEFLNWINSNVNNIYTTDGTLGDNRTITGLGLFTKFRGGDVIVEMADSSVDYAFIINEFGGVESARFGYNQINNSSILELKDSTGQYFYADSGEVKIGNPAVSSATLHVKGLNNQVAMRIDADNRQNMIYVAEISNSGFVGIGRTTKLTNEVLSVQGNISTTGILSLGSAPNTNGINMPSNYSYNIDNFVILSLSGGTTTAIDSTGNSTILFRDAFNDILLSVSQNQSIFTSKVATGAGTIQEQSIIIDSQYWDGALTQLKSSSIIHSINTVPTGESQIDFAIGGSIIVSMLDNSSVGVGTSTPSDVAILELSSTTKGLRITPMTSIQGSAITAIEGLMIFVSTTNATFTSIGFWGYESGSWVKL